MMTPVVREIGRGQAAPQRRVPASVTTLQAIARHVGWQLLVWPYFIGTVALWHATFMVNSVCHIWGKRPFDAGDASTDNWLVGRLALGEGWHNNHHRFAYSTRHGLEWWQFDLTWVFLRMLERLGLVSDLRLPRAAVLARSKASV